jgi:hypothetical protein
MTASYGKNLHTEVFAGSLSEAVGSLAATVADDTREHDR